MPFVYLYMFVLSVPTLLFSLLLTRIYFVIGLWAVKYSM